MAALSGPGDPAGAESVTSQMRSRLTTATGPHRTTVKLDSCRRPPSELAAEIDTSLQNVQYHLGNLSEAGLIEVADTRYSEKGREMNVYTPADRALVVVAGREDETKGLKGALTRLIGGVGVLGFASLLVQQVFGSGVGSLLGGPTVSSGSADTGTRDPSFYPGNTTVTDGGFEATAGALDTAAQGGAEAAAAAIPPGVAFFAGGAFVIAGMAALWYMRR